MIATIKDQKTTNRAAIVPPGKLLTVFFCLLFNGLQLKIKLYE